MTATYTKALLELLHAGTEASEALNGLSRVLKSRGHSRLYGSILKNTLRILEGKQQADTTLLVAKENDAKVHAAAIKEALQQLGANTEPIVEIDKTIIGGFTLTANHQRIDNSYKSKLVDLYRNITR